MTDQRTGDSDPDDPLPDRAFEARISRRRRLLGVDPSGVRDDPDAAAECACGCHPRPGSPRCQLTTAERRAPSDQSHRALAESRAHWAAVDAERKHALAAAAADLGVESEETLTRALWVIDGDVDGRRHYMGEHDGRYTIVIASSIDPQHDPWTSEDSHGYVVADGPGSDLVPVFRAERAYILRFIVAAVRTALRQEDCTHEAGVGKRYRPDCGLALVSPELP